MKPRQIAGAALLLLAGAGLTEAGYRFAAGTHPAPANAAPDAVDVGFTQFMRSHHDQAVVMTQILLDHGSTRLAGLALLLLAGAGLSEAWHRLAAGAPAALAAAAPGAVDVGFTQFMRSHHDQAVVMTQILLDHGSTRLASLARSIQAAQLIETGEMKGWLLLWGKPLLPATAGMDWMLLGRTPPDAALSRYLIDCRSAPGGMPGLASSEELNNLRKLDGDERDRLFLQLMMRHHQGALPMAHFAALNAETPVVRTLAAQIEVQQMEELGAMALLARQR